MVLRRDSVGQSSSGLMLEDHLETMSDASGWDSCFVNGETAGF